MEAGSLLLISKDLIGLLETKQILHADGTFDQTKLDTIQEDLEFAGGVEVILKAHGLDLPEKVEKVLAILPLVAALVQ